MPERRVVITATSAILPLGTSPPAILASLHKPWGPFQTSEADTDVAVCPINGFHLQDFTGRFKNARYLNRGQQFCLAAAIQAAQTGRLEKKDLREAGLFLGLGPNLQASPRTDKALWLLDYLPNTAAAAIADCLDIHGENLTIQTACTSSTQALGQAFRAIRSGLADVALAGGGDSRLSAQGISAYKSAGVLATGFSRPETACRPFDQTRTGFAIGEGGAMFVLESLAHAKRRKATIVAEIVSTASSLDSGSLTGPDPNGLLAEQTVARCLNGLSVNTVCLLAHGTGTQLNDDVESVVMGKTAPQAQGIVAFKSQMGHLGSACGGAELALGLLCARAGYFPGIANLEKPCAPDLPFLRQAKHLRPQGLLVQSFGFGGQNACLGVKLWT